MPLFFSALLGAVFDAVFGELRRWHPLVGFGTLATRVERALNTMHLATTTTPSASLRGRGVVAWCLCVLPPVLIAALLCRGSYGWVVHALLLYFALGAKSLGEHGQRVADDLDAGDLPAAREHVGWMVSRDTSVLDAGGVAKATVESVLENGNDAIFGALFWFALLGGPGAVLFRLANTLDAMWGYRNARFLSFGWAAARIDDVLNFVPARLTALSYALLGSTAQALQCWRTQALYWDSPNAGPVMAAGAGALDVRLGGAAVYHGREEVRPVLGTERAPASNDIRRAIFLVRKTLCLWLLVFAIAGWLGGHWAGNAGGYFGA